MLPLEDLKILELTNFLPGPYCTMILSDFGAEVIKVERPPQGDPARIQGGMFDAYGRNKKCITLDLKSPKGKETLVQLIKECDIFLEGFRPGVIDTLGFGKEDVWKINEKVIYVSISGFGQSSPYRDWPAHDINYLSIAGVLSVSGDPDGPPYPGSGVELADQSAAMFTTISVLIALRNRDKTGKGDYLDIAITDCALGFMPSRIMGYYHNNKPSRSDTMGRGGYGAFKCKDGKYLSIGCLELIFWQNLCRQMGLDEWADEPRYQKWFDRAKYRSEINPELAKRFLEKDRDVWVKQLLDADVPCTPVNEIDELPDDPHIKHRDLLQVVDGFPRVKFPVKFQNITPREITPAPRLGANNKEILGVD